MTTNNGFLLIDKPRGVTSHDVVARVRKYLNEQRVGHAGTLDPMATGLLVVAVGPSTRLLRFAQSGEIKRYSGVVTFGVSTDSLDGRRGSARTPRRSGALGGRGERRGPRHAGAQQQTPPMVSALKINGRRLHALARDGVEVDRPSREIVIESFSLEPSESPSEWSFDVTCSVGTYVRVLLWDLATQLGTIGHLSALRRLASGRHRVEDALTLEELDRDVEEGSAPLHSPRDLVELLEIAVVDSDQAQRLRHGQRVNLEVSGSEEIAAVSESGSLVAVLRRRGESWQPSVVMPDDESDARGGRLLTC